MADVMKVVAEPLFKTGVSAPSVNLRVPCKSTSKRMPQIIVRIFFRKIARELGTLRPRPHKTHITPQDVPELRKLVEATTAQVVTDAGASRVARHRPDRPEVALCLFAHRSEFENGKPPPVQTHTCLPIENWPAVGHPDCQGDERQERCEHNRCCSGDSHIDQPFDRPRKAANGLMRAELRQYGRPSFDSPAG